MFRIRLAAARKISRATPLHVTIIRQKFSSLSRNNRAGFDTRTVETHGISSKIMVSPVKFPALVTAIRID